MRSRSASGVVKSGMIQNGRTALNVELSIPDSAEGNLTIAPIVIIPATIVMLIVPAVAITVLVGQAKRSMSVVNNGGAVLTVISPAHVSYWHEFESGRMVFIMWASISRFFLEIEKFNRFRDYMSFDGGLQQPK